MKRLIALLILFTYLCFSINAFANTFDELFSSEDLVYEEGSFSSDIKLSSDSEFNFLNAFEESFAPYSLKSFISGLANSKIHIDANYSTERNKIFKGYFKITTYSPIKLNDALSIDANAFFELWVNMNFVNSKKPYYKITLKTPMSEQYFVFSSLDEHAILFYPTETRTTHIRQILQNGLRTNAKIVFEDGGYKLSVNDEGFKNILDYLTKNAFSHMYLIANGNNDDKQKFENQKNQIPGMMHRLKLVDFLGTKGISQKFTFDKHNKLNRSELDINIDTSISKLYYAITGVPAPTGTNIEKPVININNSDIKFDISIDTTYSKKFKDFYYPRPIKALITNVFAGQEYSMDYTTSKEVSSPYETISVISPGFTTTIDGIPHIPLRTMLNSLGVNNKSIFWEDGNIEIYEEIASVLPFNRITLAENSNSVVCDGIEVTLSSPVICIDHIAYVPEDFVQKVLDATILEYKTIFNHYDQMYYTSIDIERLKPVYYIHLKDSSISIIN